MKYFKIDQEIESESKLYIKNMSDYTVRASFILVGLRIHVMVSGFMFLWISVCVNVWVSESICVP